MSTLSNSPITVATELATESDYQLPYFSPNEQSVIVEWGGDDENNLAPPHAYTRLLISLCISYRIPSAKRHL